MRRFRVLSLILVVMMIVSTFSVAFSDAKLLFSNDKVQIKGLLNAPQEKFDPIKINEVDSNEIISVIVELEDKPLLALQAAKEQGAERFLQTQSAQSLRNEMLTTQAVVKNSIMSSVGQYVEFTYEYTNALNGFATKVKRGDVEKLKNIPGVKGVYLDVRYEVPVEPKMTTSYEMIGDVAKLNVGLDGEGTVVAVIDTGVLVDHEIMKLDSVTKVAITASQVKEVLPQLNAYKRMVEKELTLTGEQVFKNEKFPFTFDYADVDDDATANGSDHGVHVAGTIGANGTAATADGTTISAISVFNGIARNAQILGMKVFSDKVDGAYDSDIFAAIEDAIVLNADVINLSLGTTAGFTFYEGEELVPYEYEYVLKKARDAGIFIAAASGNDGRVNGWTQLNMFSTMSEQYFGGYGTNPFSINPDTSYMGSPGLKKSATAVASADNIFAYVNYMIFGETEIPYLDATTVSFKDTFEGKEIEVVYANEGVVDEDAERDDFAQINVKDKVVLVKRGGNNFADKVANAVTKGAIGCIIFNNDEKYDSIISVGLDANTEYEIPVISLRTSDGAKLQEILKAKNNKITVELGIGNKQISNMFVSEFSSWGANPDLGLNPEITAPGGNIYSASYSSINPSNNAYVSKSGTSMATPHVAGAAALMKEYIEGTEKDWFKDLEGGNYVTVAEALLMSTAKTMVSPEGRAFSPRQQGAGLMNIEAAIKSPAYILNEDTNKAKVELKEIGKEFSFTFDVYNLSDESVSYTLGGCILSEESVVVEDDFGVPPKAFTTDKGYTFAGSSMEFAGGNTISVAPKSSKQVTVNVKLSDVEVEELLSKFENGFFVEGFVELKSADAEKYPDLSIPYMGFYEDWTKAPIIDEPYPYEIMNYTAFYGTSYILNNEGMISQEMCSGVFSSYAPPEYYEANYLLGMYSVMGFLYGNYDFISFSPNGDSVLDDVFYRASLLRNAKAINVNIKDANGEIVRELGGDIYYPKTYARAYNDGNWYLEYLVNTFDLPAWDGKDADGKVMADGEYVYEISAYLDYDSEKAKEPQVKALKVKLDTVAPKIEATYDETTDSVTVKLTDDFTLESYAIGEALADGSFGNVTSKTGYLGATAEQTFDVSMFEGDKAYFEVRDRAFNLNSVEIDISKTNTVVVDPKNPGDDSDDPGEGSDDPGEGGGYTPPVPTPDPTPVQPKPDVPTPVDPEKVVVEVEENQDGTIVAEVKVPEDEPITKVEIPVELGEEDGVVVVEITNEDGTTKKIIAVYENGKINVKLEGNATVKVVGEISALNEAPAFEDTSEHWAKEEIDKVAKLGIFNGKSATNFGAEDNMTREQMWMVLSRLQGEGQATMEDAKTWAMDNGITDGTNPKGDVTREQLVTLIWRASGQPKSSLELSDFNDSNKVSSWAKDAFAWAVETGLVNGTTETTLSPQGTATRAQLAAILARLVY